MTLSHADGETGAPSSLYERKEPALEQSGQEAPGPGGWATALRATPSPEASLGRTRRASTRRAACGPVQDLLSAHTGAHPARTWLPPSVCWCRSSAQRGPREQGLC